jgi:hypothetical protein
VIHLIPKTPTGFDGTVSNMRPISLLETVGKLLMKVLLNRIHRVNAQHGELRGARYSGAPGTCTTAPISILRAAAGQAALHGREQWVYLEDKSKAFDTVPHPLLKLAMRRIRLPQDFIDFYIAGFLEHRSAQVNTGHSASPFR